MVTPDAPVKAVQSAQVVRGTSSGNPASDFRQQAAAIGRAYLFGKAEAKQVEVVQPEEVVETKLNYKLRGIYYSPNEALSSAIVEIKPNKSEFFRLNDEMAENITLARVELDHILINRYGKLERLNLQKRDPSQSRAVGGLSSSGNSARLTVFTQNPS